MNIFKLKTMDNQVAGSIQNNSNAAFFKPVSGINQPNDMHEQEADHMADKVMRMSDPSTNQPAFFKPANNHVQRKCQACKEEEKQVHRKENNTASVQDSSQLNNYVSSLGSSGQKMSESSRSFFEPRFGYDFSNVRLHTDSIAAKSARSINALAYTTGNNIVFNNGQYAPDSDSGKKLMAHELTHVIQQGNGQPANFGLQRAPAPAPINSPDAAVPADNPVPTPITRPSGQPAPPVQAQPAGTISKRNLARLPLSRTSTAVGVGERMELTLSTGTAATAWTATAGTFKPPKGAAGDAVTFAAPDTGQTVTVNAGGASLAFDVIAPTDVHMDPLNTTAVHNINRPDVGMTTIPFLLPDTVNFSNVSYHEINIGGKGNGVFSCLTKGHCDPVALQKPCTDIPLSSRVIAGKGTQANNATDCAYSSDCNTKAPFASGSLTIEIPCEYNVDGGSFHPFTKVKQVHKLNGSALSVTKAGASLTTTVAASTSLDNNCPP